MKSASCMDGSCSRSGWRALAVALTLVGATLAAPHALGAQVILGSVVLPDGVTPAANVLVTVLDARDSIVARALTGDRGRFVLRVGAPGAYRVRALRVGFHPTESPALVAAVGEVIVRLVLNTRGIRLGVIVVRSSDRCRARPDSGNAVADVWEEARKALMASELAIADEAPLLAEWIQYDRVLDPTGRFSRRLAVRSTRSPTQRAFRSVPVEQLVAEGYVVTSGDDVVFNAPDAAVLLSESFASTHCFRLVNAPAGDPGLIGIAFAPVGRPAELREVEGTLWLDRASAELRSLEFRYTGLPEAALRAEAGGAVEFLRLENGRWLVGRWWIRMPTLAAPQRQGLPGGMRRILILSNAPVVSQIQVTGGEVTRVEQGDTTLYARQGNTLDVSVTQGPERAPVAGALVSLDGTDYVAISDSSGNARFAPILAGRYTARATTDLADAVGGEASTSQLDVADGGRSRHAMRLATAEEMSLAICGRDAQRSTPGLVFGVARDATGRSLVGAAVIAERVLARSVTATDVTLIEQTVGTLTGPDGAWRLCGLPIETDLVVAVSTDDGRGEQSLRLSRTATIARIEFVWPQAVAARDTDREAPLTALLDIVVRDVEARPVTDALVELESGREATRVARTVRTNQFGRAVVPAMPVGELRVRVRRPGFVQGRFTVDLVAGRNTLPIILDGSRAPTLDTVRVVGNRRVLTRHGPFEQRLRSGTATESITADQITHRNPVSAWQMLSTVPSVSLLSGPDGVRPYSRRLISANVLTPTVEPCYMQLAIDGIVIPGDVNLERDMPPVSEIHGIEVFAGPASIPPEYSALKTNAFCGLIVVWTK